MAGRSTRGGVLRLRRRRFRSVPTNFLARHVARQSHRLDQDAPFRAEAILPPAVGGEEHLILPERMFSEACVPEHVQGRLSDRLGF